MRTPLIAALLFSPTALVAPGIAHAQSLDDRAADAVLVLNGTKPADEVFVPAFLAAISANELRALGTTLEAQFGKLLAVEKVAPGSVPGSATIALRFERAIGQGVMQLETKEPFRITGLRLTSFDPLGDGPDQIARDLESLPGETSVVLTRLGDDRPLFALHADRQLAIGSTMKLYVLSALAREIGDGKRAWADVVPLGVKSLPSGQTQAWPDKSPVTLHTLATLMISVSDNTATDTLITLLGHEAIEAEMRAAGHGQPDLNVPFMTTRQSFLLKGGDTGQLYTYAHANEMDRKDMLADLAGAELDSAKIMAAFAEGPRAIDVEWFASADDIARIFARIQALPDRTALDILAINPSLGDAGTRWTYAGYKGGSEPGVLNLSWLLQDKTGAWHVLSMGWNNARAAVDQQTFALIGQRLLRLVPDAVE